MKKLNNNTILLLITVILTSCASKFKTLTPENQEFSTRIETNDLLIEYNPDILKHSKNSKLQKKAEKKNLSFIVAKFTNKSNEQINLSKDIKFNTELKDINDSYKKLKQKPWTYYLALISAGFSIGSKGSSGFLGINPLALIYSIPNSIVASVANKKLKKELQNYEITNKILAPNESNYAIITYDNKENLILNIETIKGEKVKSEITISKYGSLIIENCIKYDRQKYTTYQEYRNNLIKCLEESSLVRNVTPFEKKYKNGNLKILGLHAKHQLGKNNDYLYKIGTWAYYNEDGTIEKLIEYDVNGKEIKK